MLGVQIIHPYGIIFLLKLVDFCAVADSPFHPPFIFERLSQKHNVYELARPLSLAAMSDLRSGV